MPFFYPKGGGKGASNDIAPLQAALEAIVSELTLMRKAMEEMGCFVGIDCGDTPIPPDPDPDPDPSIPECALYSGGQVLVTSTGAYIVLSYCGESSIPSNTLYVDGQPLVDSQGNYIVGG